MHGEPGPSSAPPDPARRVRNTLRRAWFELTLREQKAILLVLALVTALPAGAGEWLEDPITGCQIWNDEPLDGVEVASWSGQCDEGQASGTGVLSWYHDGTLLVRFKGSMGGGKVDGYGTLDYLNDDGSGYDHYQAQFADGEFEGHVVLLGANGDRFEGEMAMSVIEGYGSFSDAEGNRYDGDFVGGLPEGEGL